MKGQSLSTSLTQTELKRWVVYNPETGLFTWRYQPQETAQWNGRFGGKVAGHKNKRGYIKIGINSTYYAAHRLAFLYMLGYMPDYVDHKDNIADNNVWDNLRAATNSENVANKGAYRTNTSGYKNVSWAKTKNKWYVKVVKDGNIHGGYYESLEKAVSIANSLRLELFGEFAFQETYGGD